MLAAVPLYGALVARLPRRRFIPLVYHFFVANLAVFWLLLDARRRARRPWRACSSSGSACSSCSRSRCSGRSWPTVYNSEQGKRLYGFIAAGGSAGALAGPAITIGLAQRDRRGEPADRRGAAARGRGALRRCSLEVEKEIVCRTDSRLSAAARIDGILMVLRSPYIAGITLWVCAACRWPRPSSTSSRRAIVAAASDDPAVRTRIFAAVDLAVGLLTLAVQFVATGKLIARFGVGPALALLPLVFAAGFAVLAAAPLLAVVIAFQALQRTANFAISNPAREVLFTVRRARREVQGEERDRHRRGARRRRRGRLAVHGAALARHAELRAIPVVAIVIAGACLFLAVALGRAQERRAGGA